MTPVLERPARVMPASTSVLPTLRQQTSNTRSRRRIGAEHRWSELRRSGELYRRIAQAINCGELGYAMDHPVTKDGDLARCLLEGIKGGANGYAASGFPAAAGGVDISGALMSVRPGIRKIKKMVATVAVPLGTQSGFQIPLPNAGYIERVTLRINGQFQIVQGATAQAITMNDLRTLIQGLRFELSSTVVPKRLSGLAHDIIDALDVAVVFPNTSRNVVPTSGSLSGAANSTVNPGFTLYLSPRFTISDQNLFGIPYLGALSTVPQLVIDFANLLGTGAASAYQNPMTAAAAGPTASMPNTTIQVDGTRIDLPAPVAPQQYQDAEGNTQTTPGQGLWAESGYLLTTKLAGTQSSVGAGSQQPFHIPIGPMYARLILLCYVDGLLDTESGTAPQSILDHSEIQVQEATTIESRYPWQFSEDYFRAYYKTRPAGVYVHSGIDQSGTDEDLWVTQDLGNFDVVPYVTANADGNSQTKIECYTQALQPISAPGLYA